jgi:hypothetical protein
LNSGVSAIADGNINEIFSGAPIVPFFNVSPDEFRFTKGEPAIYRSSDHAGRSFCAVCSTQLIFRDDKRPEDVDIVTITLDDPNSGPQPALHVFCESQVKWFNVQDDLPRYQRMASEDEKQNEKPATVINPVMHYD